MPIFAYVLIVVGALFAFGYLSLRFNSIWVYRVLDRSNRNATDTLDSRYELPRYFKLNEAGVPDNGSKWPGWDGWYFFMVPDTQAPDFKMIRGSLMTGLYGLDGVDNRQQIPPGASGSYLTEYLNLIPTGEPRAGDTTAGATGAGISTTSLKRNYLCQEYLPKKPALTMSTEKLDISIRNCDATGDGSTGFSGNIRGSWPEYQCEFVDPNSPVSYALRFKAESVVWWADIPGIFTYFAAFGSYDGQVFPNLNPGDKNSSLVSQAPESYPVQGKGCFEHGFARKPFGFNGIWLPIRWLKRIFPSFKPIRYHYELLIGDNETYGGFMHVGAFGINARNRGCLYINGSQTVIKRVRVRYLDEPEPDVVKVPSSPRSQVKFYKRWHVQAHTNQGIFEYVASREWPRVPIASNMSYYYFTFQGTHNGKDISGRGYGEYLHI